MKMELKKGLAIGIPVGLLLAMGGVTLKKQYDDDHIGACPDGWVSNANPITDVYAAHTALENGQRQLETQVDKYGLIYDNEIDVTDVHLEAAQAAAIRIIYQRTISDKMNDWGVTGEITYSIDKPVLEGMGDEFCSDDSGQPHPTAGYMKVVSALENAGIPVGSEVS
jgi:hypothetical protein